MVAPQLPVQLFSSIKMAGPARLSIAIEPLYGAGR